MKQVVFRYSCFGESKHSLRKYRTSRDLQALFNAYKGAPDFEMHLIRNRTDALRVYDDYNIEVKWPPQRKAITNISEMHDIRSIIKNDVGYTVIGDKEIVRTCIIKFI